MSRDLSKDSKKLLVISDSRMIALEGKTKAFGPVVMELHHMLEIYDEITWIGFNYEIDNDSLLEVNSSKIKPILLKKVGGKGVISKLKILVQYPKMTFVILNEIKKHTYIHSRAPSNPAVIVMFLSLFFQNKNFWFKYAGTWVEEASLFYKFQRFLLKLISSENRKVTINGDFSNKKAIVSMENPCLNDFNRIEGKNSMNDKNNNGKINYCFVGGLTKNKGVHKIINAFDKIESSKIGTIHIVGDGTEKKSLLELAKHTKSDIVFHGFIGKDDIKNIYSMCHFLILASDSEGFPKVIGEAMNYGCIPIASDISCISEYIKDGTNGYLINPSDLKSLIEKINCSLVLSEKKFKSWIDENYLFSNIFTYHYYNNRIKNEIFKDCV